ncbi:MAG: hypothetical protein IJA14_04895 [Alphaproteobacteria bacterium]|nr:hypothetical protein [Alphaproteobacteria bacterium]
MNTLKLEKRGCNFWKDSIELATSDLGNYRLFGLLDLNLITNEDFNAKKAVCCYVEICTHYFDKKDKRKDYRGKTRTFIDVSYDAENGNCYGATDYCKHANEPTQKSVLETINELFGTNYEKLEIVDRLS